MKRAIELVKGEKKFNYVIYFFLFIGLSLMMVIVVNIFRNSSYFQNAGIVWDLAVFLGFYWLSTKLKMPLRICFLFTFLGIINYRFMLMYFDNSYVDYTSFIVTGLIAFFLSLMLLVASILQANK